MSGSAGEIDADDQVVVVVIAAVPAGFPTVGIEPVADQVGDILAVYFLVGVGEGPVGIAGGGVGEVQRHDVPGIDSLDFGFAVVSVARTGDHGGAVVGEIVPDRR